MWGRDVPRGHGSQTRGAPGPEPDQVRGERARCLSTHDEAQVAWPQPAQTRNRGKAKRSRFLINTR